MIAQADHRAIDNDACGGAGRLESEREAPAETVGEVAQRNPGEITPWVDVPIGDRDDERPLLAPGIGLLPGAPIGTVRPHRRESGLLRPLLRPEPPGFLDRLTRPNLRLDPLRLDRLRGRHGRACRAEICTLRGFLISFSLLILFDFGTAVPGDPGGGNQTDEVGLATARVDDEEAGRKGSPKGGLHDPPADLDACRQGIDREGAFAPVLGDLKRDLTEHRRLAHGEVPGDQRGDTRALREVATARDPRVSLDALFRGDDPGDPRGDGRRG